MKTNIKHQGEAIVVSMSGRLDFDTHIPLREDLKKIVRQINTDSAPKNIIFNLDRLEFVGSSGISPFIQLMKEFNESAPKRPRYCHVKSEFRRMIKAFDESASFDIFDTEARAFAALSEPMIPGFTHALATAPGSSHDN